MRRLSLDCAELLEAGCGAKVGHPYASPGRLANIAWKAGRAAIRDAEKDQEIGGEEADGAVTEPYRSP